MHFSIVRAASRMRFVLKVVMRMQRVCIVLIVSFIVSVRCGYALYWAKAYGGTGTDFATSVQQTIDGGYIVAGYTNSYGAGNNDLLVIKLSSTGEIEWAKTYGGPNNDGGYPSISQTLDSGYIVVGYTESYGAGSSDFLVIKLDPNGAVEWAKTFGGTDIDRATSVKQTSDGGYIVGGDTYSYGGGDNAFVIKMNSTGGLEWAKTFGGTDDDFAFDVLQTYDNGYLLVGGAWSFGAGWLDIFVNKLNSTGGLEWAKAYGGISDDRVFSCSQTSDNGYILTGWTNSYGAGSYDLFVIKINSTGGVEWTKTIGGSDADCGWSGKQTSDNGYIVVGRTFSHGAGNYDFFIIKLNSTGGFDWAKTIGGSFPEEAWSVKQTSDNGYIIAGMGVSFGAGLEDFLVTKLEANGSMGASCPIADCSPSISSPFPLITSVSPTISSPSVGVSYTPFVNSPVVTVTDICGGVRVEEHIAELRRKVEINFKPNPFSKTMVISYLLPELNKPAYLIIYDIAGREVKKFEIKDKQGNIVWDCRDNNGKIVPHGVYHCILKFNGRKVNKLIIAK